MVKSFIDEGGGGGGGGAINVILSAYIHPCVVLQSLNISQILGCAIECFIVQSFQLMGLLHIHSISLSCRVHSMLARGNCQAMTPTPLLVA